jgi:hypothetical protein
MKIKHIPYLMLTLFTLSNSVIASQRNDSDSLDAQRQQAISQYVLDLQKADYKDINQLFEKNGTVISTSKGNVNAKDFFYGFLPEIVSAKTELHESFTSNNSHYAVRFHFTFELKDGEKGDGEYIDEFIFTEHSEKLSAVYMFENLKF